MTDDTEQAAAPAAAETTPTPKPEDTQPQPEGQQEAPEGEDDDEQDGEEGDPKPKTRSAERREARRRQQEAERSELAFYRSQAASRTEALTLDERIGAPPDPRNFRDQASYAAELAAYNIQKRGAASAMAAEQRKRDEFDASRLQAREARGEELTAIARETLPDFDRTVQRISHITVPQAAIDAIAESDLRPQLMYHLGKNPDTAAALSRMTPVQAAKEIGRLEVKLSAAPANRITQAPNPLTPLKGGSAGPAKSFADLAKADDATDAIALRRAERAKQQKRA